MRLERPLSCELEAAGGVYASYDVQVTLFGLRNVVATIGPTWQQRRQSKTKSHRKRDFDYSRRPSRAQYSTTQVETFHVAQARCSKEVGQIFLGHSITYCISDPLTQDDVIDPISSSF